MNSVNIKWNKATLFQRTQKLLRALGDVGKDDWLKSDLGKFTRDVVYKRVKSGKGVNSDKTPFLITKSVSLKPLSKSYRRYRQTGIVEFVAKKWYGRIYEKVNVKFHTGVPALGPFGRPGKSNLTFSGQMLQSMSWDVTKSGFIVLIPETRRREGKLTNAQLARYLAKKGRPFMNLTSGESRIVKSRMKKQIQQKLKKLLR
jgi:hypothetical protein